MEKQFELSTEDIYVNVGENNKVTLYIVGKDGKIVRTIDEFEAKTGGVEALNVTAPHILAGKRKIERKYEDLQKEQGKGVNILERIFGHRQRLNELNDRKNKEIEEYLAPYRKALKSPKLDVYKTLVEDYDPEDGPYYDTEYGYISISDDAPKASLVIMVEDEEQINLLPVKDYLSKDRPPLTNIQELRDLQANIEEKLVREEISKKERAAAAKKEAKEREELRAKTDEYLNY